jgi:hypothetical protein
MKSRLRIIWSALFAVVPLLGGLVAANAQAQKPNILVIFGDDIGQSDISAYTFGLMGYRTPNIDRIAKEGMMFTDYYAEQSCIVGRSSSPANHRYAPTFEGRNTGSHCGTATRRHHHCRGAKAARLRHRSIWQKPSWRQKRISPDGTRLRRVLRQPLYIAQRRTSRLGPAEFAALWSKLAYFPPNTIPRAQRNWV